MAVVLAAGPAAAAQVDPGNRLAGETSPCLLRHADDPVRWHPWGAEAFETARRQGKPIFLSIGSFGDSWCRVMERESFEDERVAAFLNEHFVPVMVDREERPEVDDIYAAAVQEIAEFAGSPISVFLDPDTLGPFEGGGYYPAEASVGVQSLAEVLEYVAHAWRARRPAMSIRASTFSDRAAGRLVMGGPPVAIGGEQVEGAVAALMAGHDSVNGGLRRGSPKLYEPARVQLLMGAAWDDPAARGAVTLTLDRIAMGGVRDHVGGGFHRCSTDERWLVPCFEKLLSDNAQLASLYAKAYGLTRDPLYGEVVRETLEYVLREMTSPQGAFYSAQDAEFGERDGGAYVWTASEIDAALRECWLDEETAFALDVLGAAERGNFRDAHHGDGAARNVLHLPAHPRELAARHGIGPEDYRMRVTEIRECLLAWRARRRPLTDDTILSGWNGLMMAGMADGAIALGDPSYLSAAQKAARFVLDNLRSPDGGLLHSFRGGKAGTPAVSGDYAMLIAGLIAIHRASAALGNEAHRPQDAGVRDKTSPQDAGVRHQEEWLRSAASLAAEANARLGDERNGGWYDTPAGRDDLFVRSRSLRDGAVPCANSLMLMNLLDLYELTGDESWLDQASAALAAASRYLQAGPGSMAHGTLALRRFVKQYPERLPQRTVPSLAAPAEPVAVTAAPETVAVFAGAPGRFDVEIRIPEGYRIGAHETGAAGLAGLELRLIGRGFELEAAYPPGEPLRTRGVKGEVRVHAGSVTVPVTVRRAGPGEGLPKIVVTYQVCTDQVCLKPEMALVPVKLVVEP